MLKSSVTEFTTSDLCKCQKNQAKEKADLRIENSEQTSSLFKYDTVLGLA